MMEVENGTDEDDNASYHFNSSSNTVSCLSKIEAGLKTITEYGIYWTWNEHSDRMKRKSKSGKIVVIWLR